MLPFFTDIASYLKASMNAFSASLSASGTINGASVQLEGPGYSYKSAMLVGYIDATSGSPSAVSTTFQVQQSATGTGNWSNYTDLAGNGLITITAASTLATQSVNLQGAKQFVRILVTNALTGGSSPTCPAVGMLILGGSSENPAV